MAQKTKVKVKLNKNEIKSQLLKADWIKEFCQKQAEEIQKQCGDGYTVDTYEGSNRINAMCYADTFEARLDNLHHNTLLKAVGSLD